MQIYSINPYQNKNLKQTHLSPNKLGNRDLQCDTVSFGKKPKIDPLRFNANDFYIKIDGYGRLAEWAKVMVKTAEEATIDIKEGKGFKTVLSSIAEGVKDANKIAAYEKNNRTLLDTGKLRIQEKDFPYIGTPGYMYTVYGKSGNKKYLSYTEKLDKKIFNPLKNQYPDELSLSKPMPPCKHDYKMFYYIENPRSIPTFFHKIITKFAQKHPPLDEKFPYKTILHGDTRTLRKTLKLQEKLYNDFLNKHVLNPSGEKDLGGIVEDVARMRWIMAHSTPFARGSDSIGNTLMRSMFKAAGVKSYPPAKGISFDLEAYCTELDDYIINFPKYFEKPPEILK